MEDYVTFEQAVKLKELGFDWKCNHYYQDDDKSFHQNFYENHSKHRKMRYKEDNTFIKVTLCSAPTLSQVQKWLREVKDIIIGIDFDNWCEKYGCHVYKKTIYNSENIKDSYGSMLVTNESNEDFDTYEQALSAGIDKVLELLK